MIDRIAPASTRSRASGVIRSSDTPRPIRMNENSPICARLAAMVSAISLDLPSIRTTAQAASDLPTMMIASVSSTSSGCSSRIIGSNSMPTETKNSTANASRSGSESSAALWPCGDSLSSMPAKNAPSANDTPNSSAAPKAMPIAQASTHRVNSSREPVPATRSSTQGSTRRPTISISATKPPTLASVASSAMPRLPPLSSPLLPASAGTSTSASTIARSSTISQPIAIRPRSLSSMRPLSSARSRTTVLATDRARPKMMLCGCGQPRRQPRNQPIAVATAICTIAPGTAM